MIPGMDAENIPVGVGGALGRMGRAVALCVAERDGMSVGALFDRPDIQTETLSSLESALATCAVVIDFSTGPATAALALAGRSAAVRGERAPALVLGATGLTVEEEAAVGEASSRLAIVRSGNFSVGVNVLAGLVEQAARRLGPDIWDIEVLEAHHRRKVDAPSGTALMLAHAAARGRGRDLADLALPPRAGITGPRPDGAIGMASLRGGGIIGEHSVIFVAEEETVTLSHVARDRALFARGAVEAAAWVVRKPPGLYDMVDVLGFRG